MPILATSGRSARNPCTAAWLLVASVWNRCARTAGSKGAAILLSFVMAAFPFLIPMRTLSPSRCAKPAWHRHATRLSPRRRSVIFSGVAISNAALVRLQLPGAGQIRRRCYPQGSLSEGKNVRLIVALFLIFAFHGPLLAQTTQCQSIPKASDRLACYDRATPPIGASKAPAAKGKTAATNSPPEQVQAVDMLAAENSKLDAKLKTICRGR